MFNWIFKIKYKSNKVHEMSKKYLIVGLGNIGSDYTNTRHNIGFKVVDYLASVNGASFETKKLGDIATFRFKGRVFILLKPNTFMNLSGKAVKYWITKEKIQLDNICIVTDDKNIDFGTIRIKTKGSAGGHNGIKSIIQNFKTEDFKRIKVGIDRNPMMEQKDYVLSKFSKAEQKELDLKVEVVSDIIDDFKKGTDFINIMNTFN